MNGGHETVGRSGSLRSAWAECQRAWRAGGTVPAAAAAAAMARHAIGRRLPAWAGHFRKPLPRREGTLFIGYLDAALGLGESLRGLVRSVATQGIPFALRPVTAGVQHRPLAAILPERRDMVGRYDINVIEVATDQLPHVYHEVGPRRFASSYNILRPYWELPRIPAEWAPLLQDIDEVWAPSRFVADAFAAVFSGPVIIVPPCIDVPPIPGTEHGGAEQRFRFMFSFDYESSPLRKNPMAVVAAFRAAFPLAEVGPTLLIKSTGLPPPPLASAASQALHRELADAARSDRRIEVVDSILSRDEMLGLIDASGCYVSLHRSEGFGLGMAEAMALGTAVIGTDYSGSRDFLTEQTGFPVACSLVPVRPGEYSGGDGQHWAQPDIAAAAAAMQRVFADRAVVQSRTAAAKALMADRFGRETVGRIAALRLGQIQGVIRKARMP